MHRLANMVDTRQVAIGRDTEQGLLIGSIGEVKAEKQECQT